jgi:hypothetical protein
MINPTLPLVPGGAVNHGLKRFFSLYRPLHLIEAYYRRARQQRVERANSARI